MLRQREDGKVIRVGMIHQPHFLPWPGYVARCLAAHTVVLLEGVKFNGGHFQHRTKFVSRDGVENWLTLPIAHHTRTMPISEVEIANSFSFMRWQRRFRDAYQEFATFGAIWQDLGDLIRQDPRSLLAVTSSTLAYLIESMSAAGDNRKPVLKLGRCNERALDRTKRLVEICAEEQFTHLIMGRDAITCHDCGLLRENGLTLVRHVYRGSAVHAPRPGVTVLDDVFRLGGVEVAQRLTNDWFLEPISEDNGLGAAVC
jgi:hypothetical protein